jgi:S1-C subfamily serine protease
MRTARVIPFAAGLLAVAFTLAVTNPGLAQDRLRPPLPLRLVVEITAVQPYGPAYRAGLEVGDQILEVEGIQVRSLPALRQLLQDAGNCARLTVQQRRTGRAATIYVYPSEGRIGIDARMVEAYPDSRYPY